MVTAITNIRSKNDDSGKQVFYRIKTDKDGFEGKIHVLIGPAALPDQDAGITGTDSTPFSATHSQSGRAVVKISADTISSSAFLDLDQPSDP